LAWEKGAADLEAGILKETGLDVGDADSSVEAGAAIRSATGPAAGILSRWVEHERRTFRQTQFTLRDIRVQVHRAVQSLRGLPHLARGRRAMTMDQAKNREFPRVVVLPRLSSYRRRHKEATRGTAVLRRKCNALQIRSGTHAGPVARGPERLEVALLDLVTFPAETSARLSYIALALLRQNCSYGGSRSPASRRRRNQRR
jgi:hypothetical protein